MNHLEWWTRYDSSPELCLWTNKHSIRCASDHKGLGCCIVSTLARDCKSFRSSHCLITITGIPGRERAFSTTLKVRSWLDNDALELLRLTRPWVSRFSHTRQQDALQFVCLLHLQISAIHTWRKLFAASRHCKMNWSALLSLIVLLQLHVLANVATQHAGASLPQCAVSVSTADERVILTKSRSPVQHRFRVPPTCLWFVPMLHCRWRSVHV